jgi:Domain of unknown function (DUF4432)
MCRDSTLCDRYGNEMALPPLATSISRSEGASPRALRSSGQISRDDVLASASMARLDGGPADAMRVVDVAMESGMRFQILPDRGLDIGAAWAFDQPIGWQSQVGHAAPLSRPDGMAWIERFTGGLLTTCGPDNIGVPCVDGDESLGLHGAWSFLKAADVQVHRGWVDDEIELHVTGRLEQTHALGRHLVIHRTITTRTGAASIEVSDVIENAGHRTEPIPMLYHLNFGAPLWGPGARVRFPVGTRTTPRTPYAEGKLPESEVGPVAIAEGAEYVFERQVPGPDSSGVQLISARTGLTAEVLWTRDSLPTSHQWIHPAKGVYALGIEPANAALGGRAELRAAGVLPMLDAGERRQFAVRVTVCRSE